MSDTQGRVENLVLVLGGAASGKSAFALKLAHEAVERRGGRPAYLATAEALDSEMALRIEEHRKLRGPEWTTIEEPLDIAVTVRDSAGFAVILLDCLTLWISNLIGAGRTDGEIIEEATGLVGVVRASATARVIVVTSEVGLGLVPETPLGRRFRDLAGRVNQIMTEAAKEVYLVTAGIATRLK